MLETVQGLIARNARETLTPEEIAELEEPDRIHPYYQDTEDGPVVAARVQHRIDTDGSGGGFKMVEVNGDMSPEDMQRMARIQALGLATLMSFKGEVIDLSQLAMPDRIGEDVGGAKGVMLVPRGTLSSPEKRKERFGDFVLVQAKREAIGIGIDRIAPDMNTDSELMDHGAQLLIGLTKDERSRAAFSGKSIEAGGLPTRERATAQSLVYTLANQLEAMGRDPRKTTIAIQGSGNVGYYVAKLAEEQLGVKIVGMSDRYKAIAGSAAVPLRIDESITFANREIATWNDELYQVLQNPDDLFAIEADVFIFAGPPDSITAEKGNIDDVAAEIFLEGANNPLDLVAIDHNRKKGKKIIPGILGNAGGFVDSNQEYNQGVTGIIRPENVATQALRRAIDDGYARVFQESGGDLTDLVDAAYRLGIKSRYERDHSGPRMPLYN